MNPSSGQAPLPCVFSGGASGGEAPYEFYWDFGDGAFRNFDSSAVAPHTYVASGTYYATLTVRDNQGLTETSGVVPVFVMEETTFTVRIEADATEGPVPFNVQFTSFVESGKEPVHFNWEVFTDLVPGSDEPIIVLPPGNPTPHLSTQAVVVPTRTAKPNPVIAFGTYVGQMVAGADVGAPYAVRLVATDDNGVQAVSNLVRITPRQPEPSTLYRAFRPPVTGTSAYGSFMGVSAAFSARANPATVTHYSGMTYFFGGDILSDSGEFNGIVKLVDSSWCANVGGSREGYGYTPPGANTGNAYAADGFTLLNSYQGLPFAYRPVPGGMAPTVKNPPVLGTAFPAFMRGNRTIQRSVPFVARGAADAVLAHEDYDVNPGGAICPG